MENLYDKGSENFRPLDNSVRTSLRYQIEAEKQLEAYSNAYNRKVKPSKGYSNTYNLFSSLILGIYYLINGIVSLIIRKIKK
ncbi:MAG TPA: hypothetical protein VKY37_02875 [Brumimicrobium sp.]|nr:hypothetical protein [Brumimicrobium sp.]